MNRSAQMRVLPLWLGLCLLLGAAGCSSFSRDWRRTARMPPPPDTLEGRWEGTWSSAVNGHHGRLRCLVSRTGPDQYQARFQARYQKILNFTYAVPLQAQMDQGIWKFRGQADLGWYAGGLYHYEGQATPTNFFSAYRAKDDHGIFQMTRPAAP